MYTDFVCSFGDLAEFALRQALQGKAVFVDIGVLTKLAGTALRGIDPSVEGVQP